MSGTNAPMVIVLAAGRGERFRAAGGTTHKLDAVLGDRTVLGHVLDAVRSSGLALHLVRPAGGTAGMGASIALGVRATPEAGGWLVLPGDLPLVSPDSLRRVAGALASHAIVVPHRLGQRGHPVGFGRACFEALAQLDGDGGAAGIVQAQRRSGGVLDLALHDRGILLDVDTPAALARAARLLRARGRRREAAHHPDLSDAAGQAAHTGVVGGSDA